MAFLASFEVGRTTAPSSLGACAPETERMESGKKSRTVGWKSRFLPGMTLVFTSNRFQGPSRYLLQDEEPLAQVEPCDGTTRFDIGPLKAWGIMAHPIDFVHWNGLLSRNRW